MIAIKQLIPQLSCRIQLSNSDVLLYPPRTRDGVTIRYSTISCEHSANRLRAAFLLCCLENVKDFLLFTTKCENLFPILPEIVRIYVRRHRAKQRKMRNFRFFRSGGALFGHFRGLKT